VSRIASATAVPADVGCAAAPTAPRWPSVPLTRAIGRTGYQARREITTPGLTMLRSPPDPWGFPPSCTNLAGDRLHGVRIGHWSFFVQLKIGFHRATGHMGIIEVGLSEPTVAPEPASPDRSRPGTSLRVKSYACGAAVPHQFGMLLPPMSVAADLRRRPWQPSDQHVRCRIRIAHGRVLHVRVPRHGLRVRTGFSSNASIVPARPARR